MIDFRHVEVCPGCQELGLSFLNLSQAFNPNGMLINGFGFVDRPAQFFTEVNMSINSNYLHQVSSYKLKGAERSGSDFGRGFFEGLLPDYHAFLTTN